MQDHVLFGQFGRPEKITLSLNTFWKISLAMALSASIILIILMIIGFLNQSRSDPSGQEQALQHQAEQIMRDLESALLKEWEANTESLDQTFPAGRVISEPALESWIAEKPDMISVSIHESNRPFPIQRVASRFWDSPIIKTLRDSERQRLLQFIFSAQSDAASDSINLIHISTADNPLIRAPVSSAIVGRQYVLIQELMPLGPIIDRIQSAGVRYTLVDRDGITLSSYDVMTDASETNNPIQCTAQSFLFGWNLTLAEFQEKRSGSSVLAHHFFYPALTFLVILSFAGIALAITYWIDKPMKPLYETAMRISRGDFSLRLPGSKSKNSNRLVRLINYMVEEMDHLQQINVSKILIEKKKTETILKNIADAVIVTDNADRILVLNIVAEKWFDCVETVVQQQEITKIFKERALIQMIQRVRKKGQPDSAEFQMRILGHDQPWTLHAHGAPVKSLDDRHMGVVTVIRDVSEERELDRLKTELVSMVAHELKSPLTSIYGFSELLLKSELKNEKSREYSRVILNESSRLTDLVNKFLDLSKLESGKTEPRMIPFDVQDSIRNMLGAHEQLASKKKIRVVFDSSYSVPHVLGDPDLVNQVLLNLFSNAIKYSPSGSKVGIEVKSEGRYVTIQVIDNGQGISKNALPHIFNKFYRAPESAGENTQNGSGLGLALVKEIVEKLNGRVKVQSKVGVGSIFSFSLPQAVRE